MKGAGESEGVLLSLKFTGPQFLVSQSYAGTFIDVLEALAASSVDNMLRLVDICT